MFLYHVQRFADKCIKNKQDLSDRHWNLTQDELKKNIISYTMKTLFVILFLGRGKNTLNRYI